MISVIIPTYNRGYKISRTIDSVLNQTYRDIEVIVVDDGSKDNTKEVLDSYHDERIRYHKLRHNSGCAKARNIAIDMAKGEYIAFIDSDDFWYPNKLERQLEFIKENQCDVTFCRYDGTENDHRWLFPEDYVDQGYFTVEDFLARNYASTQCIMGKREVFVANRFNEDIKTFQDWELLIRVAGHYSVKYQKEILVEYHIFDDSMSKNVKVIPQTMMEMLAIHQELFDANPDKKEEFLNFHQYFVDIQKKEEYYRKIPYIRFHKKREKDNQGSYLFAYGKKSLINKLKYRLLSILPNGKVSEYIDKAIKNDFKKIAKELGLFSDKWYRNYYGINGDGFKHYLTKGYRLGYDPNPNFSSAQYMKINKDVNYDDISPLEHFLKVGYKEKTYHYSNLSSSIEHCKIIEQSPYFDEEYYLKQLGTDVKSAVVHYLDIGYLLGLNPSPSFHNDAYMSTFYELNFNPLLHYEQYGKDEGRTITKVCDAERFNQEMLNADYEFEKTAGKNILIISHELSRTGAPRAVLNLAKRLKYLGYHIVVVSPSDGPMRKEFEDSGIAVYVNIYLFGHKDNAVYRKWKEYVGKFDCVFFNTVVAATAAHTLKDLDVRKIHWIHEGSSTFEDNPEIFDYQNNTQYIDELYAVSEYSKEICANYTDKPIEILPYGIDDISVKRANKKNKLNFVLAGSICQRKGHDVLLEALSYLKRETLDNIEIEVIGGSIDAKLRQKLIDSPYSYLSVVGEVNHEEMLQRLANSDVLLCPSLDDPLPIVCAEAMMLEKIVIVSDHSGTSSYINDGYDGYVVKAGDSKSLAMAIERCVLLDESQRIEMGIRARKIYEEAFTMDAFDKALLKIFGLVDSKE